MMMSLFADQIVISVVLCLSILLLALIKLFRKQWWTPFRIQKFMALQGIKGPPYKIIHGNIKEINSMVKRARESRPKIPSHDSLSKVLPHVQSWTKIYGKNFLQWFGTEPLLVISELEMCKEILNNKDGAYRPKISFYMKRILAEKGITLADGEQWKKLRKPADLAFHGEGLKRMISTMVACAESMLDERWKNNEGKEIEVFKEFTLLTAEMISRTAFGSSYLEGKKIFEMLTKLHSMTFKHTYKFNIKSMFFKPTAQIEVEEIEKQLRSSLLEIVKKREKKAMSGEVHDFGNDYLGLLLKAHHDSSSKQRISVEELVDECKAFHWLGHALTDHLMAWAVFLLALNPDWQEKARKEVLELFGKQTPNPLGLTKLKTMSMIIYETLRLYPPFPATIKKATKEVKLGHITVPANTKLFIPVLAFHYDAALWGQDVKLFKPERFSEGASIAAKEDAASCAFLPFGMGARTCVGRDYSTIQAKIVLSMILQRYTFELSPTYVHSPIYYLTIHPQYGVQVVLRSL